MPMHTHTSVPTPMHTPMPTHTHKPMPTHMSVHHHLQLLPPSAYLDTPASNLTTKFVIGNLNKVRAGGRAARRVCVCVCVAQVCTPWEVGGLLCVGGAARTQMGYMQ